MNRNYFLFFSIIIMISGIVVLEVVLENRIDQRDRVSIDITAEQFQFTPNQITVDFGVLVHLQITTLDIIHGIEIVEFGINEKIIPGEVTNIEFIANQRGEFNFFCNVFCGSGHANHIGSLIVV